MVYNVQPLHESLDMSPQILGLQYVEYLLPHLADDEIEEKTIEPVIALKYRGDFNGLLLSIGVPKELLYLTCLLNDISSPISYDGVNNHLRLIKVDVSTTIIASNLDFRTWLKRAKEKELDMTKPDL